MQVFSDIKTIVKYYHKKVLEENIRKYYPLPFWRSFCYSRVLSFQLHATLLANEEDFNSNISNASESKIAELIGPIVVSMKF